MTDLSLLFLTVLKYANNIDYSVKKVLYRKEIKVMLKKEMSLHDYYYDLPEELIAQDPLEDRSSSRLMVLDKNTGEIEHHIFKDIIDYLNPNDCLVINDTKVIPARLYGSKVGTDAKIEVLLLKRKENDVWETLVKPGKKCKPGTVISFGDGILTGEVIDVVEEGNRLIKFTYEGEIHFGFKLKKDYIDFYVKDTGIGISEEKLSHIFGRFVKLNSFVQGTGLGLAICQMIVEKMGGAITVESELHEGSTFRFTIPYDMYNKQEKFKKNAEREQHLKVAIKSLQLRTLLVAEDVDSNFLLMNTVLGKKYKLIRARDGREAVDMYKENHPDLIFMDIKMPYMDGLEATRLIRGYSKDIPIIALTAFAFESDRERAIEAGCNDYLTKPVSQEAIEKILDKYSL